MQCACGGQRKSSGDSYSPFALLDIGLFGVLFLLPIPD